MSNIVDNATSGGILKKAAVPNPLFVQSTEGDGLPLDGRTYVSSISNISSLRACYPGILVLAGDENRYYKVLTVSATGKPLTWEPFLPEYVMTYEPDEGSDPV